MAGVVNAPPVEHAIDAAHRYSFRSPHKTSAQLTLHVIVNPVNVPE